MTPHGLLSGALLLAGLVCHSAFPAIAYGRQSDDVVQHQYEGSLGKSRIGMTILREGDKIEGGHYFYQRYLVDIPITGTVEDGSRVTLREPGGGTFHLHFVGNGSEGNEPLDFENSIGMEGTWSSADGSRSYPVTLHGTVIRDGEGGRRYGDVTTEDDARFERHVQTFFRAVLNGDKATAVASISYPLDVSFPNGKSRKYENAAQVLAGWNDLFTPAMMALLRQDLPHDMFVHDGMAMLGNGEAWFDARGLAALNVPAASRLSSSSGQGGAN